MNRTTLLALAERVEAMRGPTCVVDVEIAVAVGCAGENSEGAMNIRADPDEDGWLLFEMNGEPIECCNRAPPYTASLDAAMSLVPSGCLFMVRTLWDDGKTSGYAVIQHYEPTETQGLRYDGESVAIAATPALALTAASLRAIAGSLPD